MFNKTNNSVISKSANAKAVGLLLISGYEIKDKYTIGGQFHVHLHNSKPVEFSSLQRQRKSFSVNLSASNSSQATQQFVEEVLTNNVNLFVKSEKFNYGPEFHYAFGRFLNSVYASSNLPQQLTSGEFNRMYDEFAKKDLARLQNKEFNGVVAQTKNSIEKLMENSTEQEKQMLTALANETVNFDNVLIQDDEMVKVRK